MFLFNFKLLPIFIILVSLTRYSSCAQTSDAVFDVNNPEDPKPGNRYEIWILSLLASCVIGLSGIAPLILIPLDVQFRNDQASGKILRLLLSFAVGGLLGDVFLHLLPEAWNYQKTISESSGSSHLSLGLYVLFGIFSFIILELMFTASKCNVGPDEDIYNTSKNAYFDKVPHEHPQCSTNGLFSCGQSGNADAELHQRKALSNGKLSETAQDNRCATTNTVKPVSQPVSVAGYLNLMANGIDNFTHGLAVAASFLVGCKMGCLTTFAILIHEIPHEIGDFAILLKSGFHPWSAAKAQLSTATIGMLGVIVALSAESIDQVGTCTSWILPFSAGGFLHIALVNVLPELLNETDPRESLKQLLCMCAGIGVMAIVTLFV